MIAPVPVHCFSISFNYSKIMFNCLTSHKVNFNRLFPNIIGYSTTKIEGLKALWRQGRLEQEFYSDTRIDYNLNVMRQYTCLVVTHKLLITLLTSLIPRRWTGCQIKLFILVGWGRSFFVCCLVHFGSTDDFPCFRCSVMLLDTQ